MWTRRYRRRRSLFPPTRGCITRHAACWCGRRSGLAWNCGRATSGWAKRALQKQGRYAHAQQLKRARKETRKLRTYLGRVMRDIQRKAAASGTELDPQLSQYLERAARIYRQQRADKHKLYSMQAPEVECISKGKEHKKYEFGCKVSVVAASLRGKVVGIAALHGNPYDGHTLKAAHAQVEQLSGVKPEE